MTSLSTFPLPLLRLVLLGGGGFAPAWGPLFHTQRGLTAFDPWYSVPCGDHYVRLPHPALSEVEGWSLPLDASSPWSARLAMVAAWMLSPRHRYLAATIACSEGYVALTRVRLTDLERGLAMGDWTWGANGKSENAEVNLPTLPAHLATRPPEVALLLALFDVPEIRARVEAVCPA